MTTPDPLELVDLWDLRPDTLVSTCAARYVPLQPGQQHDLVPEWQVYT
jgi:hypothetical protein